MDIDYHLLSVHDMKFLEDVELAHRKWAKSFYGVNESSNTDKNENK